VATKVGQKFHKLIDKDFPLGHQLQSVANKQFSWGIGAYHLQPSMGDQIVNKDQKIIKDLDS